MAQRYQSNAYQQMYKDAKKSSNTADTNTAANARCRHHISPRNFSQTYPPLFPFHSHHLCVYHTANGNRHFSLPLSARFGDRPRTALDTAFGAARAAYFWQYDAQA